MNPFERILGTSLRMRQLVIDLARIAPANLSLLVEGETGTGKELIGECVHRASSRADQPYIVLDCRALTPASAEKELFGVEQCTEAEAPSLAPGAFELAHRGTLFLDELGDLPRSLQRKLLRVLEKKEVRRVGGGDAIPVDVRVVAATCRDLRAQVERGTFHQNLFFQIAGMHVRVPPLRERIEDLPILVRHFLSQQTPPRSIDALPLEAWALFRAHRWPGNVRELRHVVERLIFTPERALRSFTMEENVEPTDERGATNGAAFDDGIAPLRRARRLANDSFEREYLRTVLGQADGNVTRAAAVAGVSRQVLTKLLRKHADVSRTRSRHSS